MKWTTSLILTTMFAGVAYAQQPPAEKPYTPTETADMNAAYVQIILDRWHASDTSLVQEQAMFKVEHRLRLQAEKERDDAKAELAKIPAPVKAPEEAPKP